MAKEAKEPTNTTVTSIVDNKVDKKDNHETIAKQCSAEWKLAWNHQKPKKDEMEVRLKLYNNQRRDKEAVGDTTMFTIFQTVLASLYSDRMNVEFNGREEGDEETADNLNATAKYDYEEMGKDELDFSWIWDTCAFGWGIEEMEEFLREPDNNVFIPLPEVIDPILFLRDPDAVSPNGNRQHKGAMRFGGWETRMTKEEMQDHPSFLSDINFEKLSFESGTNSVIQDAVAARNEAQGRQDVSIQSKEAALGPNSRYPITTWYTHVMKDGKVKKAKVWLANDRTKLVGIKYLKKDYWPLLKRNLFPTAHDWDGTSIFDLTEDKQRARAVAQNLGIKSMKADLEPMYVYDSSRITNKNDLNFEFNKFIPLDASGKPVGDSIMPLRKSMPNMQLLDFIYNALDTAAQKATATPDIQQGAMSGSQRTLGELNLISSKTDTRYGLSAKIFGWSEKEFWQQWYQMYKDNFTSDIDEKVLRIVGAFGAKWRPVKRAGLITRIDPDVTIESTNVSRAKELEDSQRTAGFLGLAFSDPTCNRRYGLKELAKQYGWSKDRIERLFPATIDERIAEQQNDKLNVNETAPVLPEDDHNVHLEIHSKANLTAATKAHIKTHEQALSIKKTKPELFPQDASATQFQANNSGSTTPGETPPSSTTLNPAPIAPSRTSNQPTGRGM
jgi:hypothetical protein